MLEKTDASAVTAGAAGVVALSPFLSNMVFIVACATVGAFVAATRMNEHSIIKTGGFVFRAVAITAFSAGLIAKLLQSDWFAGVSGVKLEYSYELLGFVAFWVAVGGDGWFDVRDRLTKRIERFFNGNR